MRYLDLTLPGGAENVALDEALLDEVESGETLRLWEPLRPMVVVGRSSRLEGEVDLPACRELGIPVVRRVSGGAAVVTGPGCLMYAVVLSCRLRPALRAADAAHRFVLGTMAAALQPLAPAARAGKPPVPRGVAAEGISDLALGPQKFSGNSVRIRRDGLLYHGTLLYDFPLELIGRCLRMPPRQPDYRQGRPHGEFLTNLPLARAAICQALATAWEAEEPCAEWPRERTARLVQQKYSRPEWNEEGRPGGC